MTDEEFDKFEQISIIMERNHCTEEEAILIMEATDGID